LNYSLSKQEVGYKTENVLMRENRKIKDVENKAIKIPNKKFLAIWLRKVITK
jgi:hypothetical protein